MVPSVTWRTFDGCQSSHDSSYENDIYGFIVDKSYHTTIFGTVGNFLEENQTFSLTGN